MAAGNTERYTAEEFFKAFENSPERMELIDGEIIMQAAPTLKHQRIVGEIYRKTANYIEAKGGSCKPFISPADVVINDENVVEPDFFVVCDPSKLGDKRVHGAPDLVVEVTSTNSVRDYSKKLALYKQSGVREYWIIDPDEERTTVFVFGENTSIEFYNFDTPVPVGIFGGELEIIVGELLI